MHLVMLETNGNQRFIFSSPRLRDNIGASSLLTKIEEWTARELAATGAASAWCAARGLPASVQKPDDSQWVSRSSGKVIFLVDSAQQAKDVIGAVTRRVLAEAPGMDVSGVFIPLPTPSDPQSDPVRVTDAALKEVHAEAARYALQRPPAEARFSQLPFLARAKDSSLPASPRLGCEDEANDDRRDPLSLTSRVRRYRAYRARMDLLEKAGNTSSILEGNKDLLTRDPTMLAEKLRWSFAGDAAPAKDAGSEAADVEKNLRQLENAIQSSSDAVGAVDPVTGSGDFGEYAFLSKVAVIHIDGNGVGGIMKDLKAAKDRIPLEEFKDKDNVGCDRNDHDALRRFLLKVNEHLDDAVARAFAAAWARIEELSKHDDDQAGRNHSVIPVVPVILGGDDVTVITSGDYALPFAAAYLRYYEEATQKDPILKYLTPPEGRETGPMTAAAGVAIVKRNFPFHIAYDLAEKLVERAKKVGKTTHPACSTLDYHVLFDTTVLDASEALRSYKDFTTRPFRLLDDDSTSPECECDTCRSGKGSPDLSHVTPHACWERTWRRVARFKGLSLSGADENGNETDLEPFPHTRAARIRGLLSAAVREQAAHPDDEAAPEPSAKGSGAEAPESGDVADKEEKWVPPSLARARNEWTVAREEIGSWIDELGGVNALFDLMELADLLPASFFDVDLPLPPLDEVVKKEDGSSSSGAPEPASTASTSTSRNAKTEATE